MFLVSVPKVLADPLISFSSTVNAVTSIPVFNTTFVLYGVLVLEGYKYGLDGSVASEVSVVDATLTAYP